MTAKRKEVTRAVVLPVRFSQAERDAIDAIAEAEDVSAATIVRRAVKRELERLKGRKG